MGYLWILQENSPTASSSVSSGSTFPYFLGNQAEKNLLYLLFSFNCWIWGIGTKGYALISHAGWFNSKMWANHTVMLRRRFISGVFFTVFVHSLLWIAALFSSQVCSRCLGLVLIFGVFWSWENGYFTPISGFCQTNKNMFFILKKRKFCQPLSKPVKILFFFFFFSRFIIQWLWFFLWDKINDERHLDFVWTLNLRRSAFCLNSLVYCMTIMHLQTCLYACIYTASIWFIY